MYSRHCVILRNETLLSAAFDFKEYVITSHFTYLGDHCVLFTHNWLHTQSHRCTHIHTHTQKHTHTHTYSYIQVYVCVYMYVCIYNVYACQEFLLLIYKEKFNDIHT